MSKMPSLKTFALTLTIGGIIANSTNSTLKDVLERKNLLTITKELKPRQAITRRKELVQETAETTDESIVELEDEESGQNEKVLEILTSYDPHFSKKDLVQLDPDVDVLGKARTLYISNFAQILGKYGQSLKGKCESGETLKDVRTAWKYWYKRFEVGLTPQQKSDRLLLATSRKDICALLLPSQSKNDVVSEAELFPATSKYSIFINDGQEIKCKVYISERIFRLYAPTGTFSIPRKYLVEITQRKKGTLLWFHPFLKIFIKPKISLKLFAKYGKIEVNNGMDDDPGVILKKLLNSEMEFVAGRQPGLLKITNINTDLTLSKTLPRLFVVPKETTDKQLKKIATFRIKKRLSMVVYASSDVILIRTAEPLVVKSTRCKTDERYFKKCTFQNGELYIVDLRPQAAALASGGIGGGTELPSLYKCKKLFLDLVNTQAVRKAELKLFKKEDEKQWIALIKQNLRAVWRLYDLIKATTAAGKKITIAIHCMDGWDRTPQIITLLEILLDSRYRTLSGLAILVEKEWLASGHQFQLRIPKPYSAKRTGTPSPVWSQMINMIWIWVKACPELFQYGPEELIMVWREAYEGSFVGGSDGDPKRQALLERRSQFWQKIMLQEKPEIDQNANVEVLRDADPKVFYISDPALLQDNA